MNAERANDTIDAARRLQRALYRAAKASPERRFHALYDTVSRADILARAWQEVRAITAPRHRLPDPVKPIVTELNAVLRGGGAYFRVGNASRQFVQIDSYVYERLAWFLSKKTGRSGRRGKIHTRDAFHALGVYHLSGTVAWTTATPTAAR